MDARSEDGPPSAPRILQNCHDEATRFVHLLMSPGCNYLVQEDFVPFLQVGRPPLHTRPRPASTPRVHSASTPQALPVHTPCTSPHPLHTGFGVHGVSLGLPSH